MNRIFRPIVGVCCVAVMLVASCSKSYNPYVAPVTPAPVDLTRLNSLFAALRPTPQNFVVTAGFSQTVYGLYGTKLTFYPNSFKDGSGNIITSGIISLQLTEIYTPGDMIASRASTVYNGQLLASGGQVLLTATLNGQEVFANKYGIGFKEPAASQQPMYLFYGTAGTPDSVVAWNTRVTAQTGTSAPGTTASSDSSIVIVFTGYGYDTVTTHSAVFEYYQFDSCAGFNWINCDYFYTSPAQLTDVSVIMPDTSFNQSNSEAFIIFPTINAAAHMTNYTIATHTFDLPNGYYIPVGMPVDIAVATNKNGKYYYYQQTNTTTTYNMVITANMAPDSLSYIATQLQGL